MKKQIFGTIMCLMGIMFVSGGTIVNGLLACVCLAAGAYALNTAEPSGNEKNLSDSPSMGRTADYQSAA